jgi:hypothetical protein
VCHALRLGTLEGRMGEMCVPIRNQFGGDKAALVGITRESLKKANLQSAAWPFSGNLST